MSRLTVELLSRVECCCDRVLKIVSTLQAAGQPRWLTDQLARAITSVGANCFEADQARSRLDVCKCLGIAVKELNETRFWIRLIGRNGWLEASRPASLEGECLEIQRILNAMIVNTRRRGS
jgi:four helix bundle protein